METIGLRRKLDIGFEEALTRVPEALKAEGFGVLTQIDIQATLQEKLGLDFRRYRVLGACNPGLAHGALRHDLAAGVLIPCNVAIYEDDDGKATVLAVDPAQTGAARGSEALRAFAEDVRAKLQRVLDAL